MKVLYESGDVIFQLISIIFVDISVFLIDMALPVSVIIYMFYLPIIYLVHLNVGNKKITIFVALLSTSLVLITPMIFSFGQYIFEENIINRLILIFIIWIMVFFILKSSSRSLFVFENKSKRILEERNEDLEELFQTISHDLKTPIITIQGLVELMKVDVLNMNAKELARSLQSLDRSSKQMFELVRDLLELSRAGKESLKKNIFPTEKLISELIELHRVELEKDGIKVEKKVTNSKIFNDYNRLLQILGNIFINAIKYGCSGKSKVIIIGDIETESFVKIYIEDKGPGISSVFHQKIFKPFERLDTNKPGTGIGLAIVKKLALTIGAKVRVVSALNEGSRFEIFLPKDDKKLFDFIK